MATETETSQAPEGQQPPAQDPAQGQEPADTDILSELANLTDEGEPAQETPAAEEGAEERTEGDGEAKPDEQGAAETEEGEEEQEAASEETPAEEPEQDAETEKRIEKIQEAEKRQRENIAREKQQAEQEIQRQWQELQPQIQAAQQFEQIKQRARYDIGGVFEALGFGEGDMEHLAKAAFARSPKGKQDPRLREQAERDLAQKAQSSEVQELKTELQQLKQEREQEKKQQQAEQRISEYLARATQAISDDTPIVKTWMGKAEAKVKARLREKAEELSREYGEVPDPADVAKQLEKSRRAELEELGIDPDAALKKGSGDKTKTETQTADKTKTAKTLTNDLGGTTQPRSEPATDEELDAEILRDLSQGKLE